MRSSDGLFETEYKASHTTELCYHLYFIVNIVVIVINFTIANDFKYVLG